MCDIRSRRTACAALALILALGCRPCDASVHGLTDAERDGYLIWLHSLESTIATREASGLLESVELYPRGVGSPGSDDIASLVDVARAVEELESKPRLLQEPSPTTALHAMNRARSYAHLAAYDSSLVWYEIARRRDGTGEFHVELGRASLVAAVALRSNDVVRDRLDEWTGRAYLAGHEEELELAIRYMLASADTTNLTVLVDHLANHQQKLSGRLPYWQAFSLNWLGRWPESLRLLKQLLTADGISYGLDEGQRAWVLTAIPDQLFILGERQAAAPLYRALAASTIPGASVWGACQVAAFDLLAGNFLEAGTAFERLCSLKENRTWRQHACRLAALSDELERLRNEGRSHGADVYYKP